jgi:hypothetical protein
MEVLAEEAKAERWATAVADAAETIENTAIVARKPLRELVRIFTTPFTGSAHTSQGTQELI